MPDSIKQRIAEGEHQRLEFKFEISDFRKIARTLVSFSNTDGGSLLIGVKDNGVIAGVRSDEEYFMVEGAARIYCRPEVPFAVREWQSEGKRVLEVLIQEGKRKPFLAQEPDGHWTAYIRQGDENFKANRVMLKVWEKQNEGSSVTIRFRKPEQLLLEYLESDRFITISKFRRMAGLTAQGAETILVSFLMLQIIRMEYTGTSAQFSLAEGYRKIVERLLERPDSGHFRGH